MRDDGGDVVADAPVGSFGSGDDAIEPPSRDKRLDPGSSTIPSQRHRVGSRLLDAGLVAVVSLVRLWFAADRSIFSITADEPATLAMTRWLGGDGRWSMFGFATWQPGLALLVSPLHWFLDDPAAVYRGILIVNALLGGAAALVLSRLVVRFARVSPRSAAGIAALVALWPTSIAASAHAWAEPLITLLFLLTVRQVLVACDTGALGSAVAAIALASLGCLTHARLLPLLASATVIVAVRVVPRHGREGALVSVAAGLAGYLAADLVGRIIVARVWDRPAEINTVSATLSRVFRPLDVLASGLGQLSYQLIATLGFSVIGFSVLAMRALPAERSVRRRDARVLLALTGPLVALSVLFMADRPRADQMLYGRYNDAVLWPLVAIGLAWFATTGSGLMRKRSLVAAAVAAAILAGGASTAAMVGARLPDAQVHLAMVPGIALFPGDSLPTRLLLAACTSAGLLGGLTVTIAGGRKALAGVLLGVTGLIGGWMLHDTLADDKDLFDSASPVAELGTGVLAGAETVGYRFEPRSAKVSFEAQALHAHLYQWFLPDVEFRWDQGRGDGVGPYVFGPTDDPTMIEQGARIVWTDPDVELALWVEAGR